MSNFEELSILLYFCDLSEVCFCPAFLQLEILHGVLNEPEKYKDRSFFYLRDNVKNYREILPEAEFKVSGLLK